MAAAVYAARACLHTLLIEKQPMGGGQILNTSEVDNYPGMFDISGFELGQKFSEHAEKLGIHPVNEEVKEIVCRGETKKVITDRQEYESKTLIYAAGTGYRTLGVPGEEAFTGRGVSYCATCDGAFFRGKTTAVVGGGDVALEDALFLSKICQTVYLIHRRDAFRGANILQQKVSEMENIQLVLDTEVEEIGGDKTIEWIRLLCKKEGRQKTVNGRCFYCGRLDSAFQPSGRAGFHGCIWICDRRRKLQNGCGRRICGRRRSDKTASSGGNGGSRRGKRGIGYRKVIVFKIGLT